jgi:hypothetical protein
MNTLFWKSFFKKHAIRIISVLLIIILVLMGKHLYYL